MSETKPTRPAVRVRQRHFLEGSIVKAAWVVEAHGKRGRWLPIGTQAGIDKHATREDAIASAILLNTALAGGKT